jgi:sucrose-6-phosphate hydrolase SacC (GH32 family)
MTLPRKLMLRETPEGIRLFQAPIDELKELAAGQMTVANAASARTDLSASHTHQLHLTMDPGSAGDAGWKFSSKDGKKYTMIGYDAAKGLLYVDRSHSGSAAVSADFFARIEAPLKVKGLLALDLVVDRSSLELFANGGAVTMTDLVFPDAGVSVMEFYSQGGKAGSVTARVTELKSAH